MAVPYSSCACQTVRWKECPSPVLKNLCIKRYRTEWPVSVIVHVCMLMHTVACEVWSIECLNYTTLFTTETISHIEFVSILFNEMIHCTSQVYMYTVLFLIHLFVNTFTGFTQSDTSATIYLSINFVRLLFESGDYSRMVFISLSQSLSWHRKRAK